MNMAALNVYSHRISLFTQVSHTLERITNQFCQSWMQSDTVTCQNQILRLTANILIMSDSYRFSVKVYKVAVWCLLLGIQVVQIIISSDILRQ